ncbi:uncharacterized protein K489DRAFT_29238 [Dissoconium aciculare CBS 342.82]|uniref:Secreted protein n=1 Tax=Dissoconium aciculare CBS 342.82 TaxID=1314786 RepID=A0A6J3MLG2_9PEZI|nr:uncharacterized protein K489DRAFT_29238 [Dissoconium aciculare CBS 342.82]KAF1827827.1 hypothetical protein K489DRAFT_29238 [Dissoconium aciculare CBS 342.82]
MMYGALLIFVQWWGECGVAHAQSSTDQRTPGLSSTLWLPITCSRDEHARAIKDTAARFITQVQRQWIATVSPQVDVEITFHQRNK